MSASPRTFFLPNSVPANRKIASTMATIPPSRKPKLPLGPSLGSIPFSTLLFVNVEAGEGFPFPLPQTPRFAGLSKRS